MKPEFSKMEVKNLNMLRTATVDQKSYVERQGYFVNATGKVNVTQESHIVGLLKTYDGKMVAVLGKDQWASVCKTRDRRTQYQPGTRQTDQVVDSIGQTIIIKRTQVVQDAIVPYLTERHRMRGVTPIPRTTTKTIVMVIPGELVASLRKSKRARKLFMRTKAARLLDEHPGCALNVQTWMTLLNKVGQVGTPNQFSALMRELGARSVGRAMALKCWTLKVAKVCQEGTRRRPREVSVPMVFAGGMKSSKRMLDWCHGEFKTRSRYGQVPLVTIPMTTRILDWNATIRMGIEVESIDDIQVVIQVDDFKFLA